MAEGTNFYLTLPSDASMSSHPQNNGGEYTVDLPNSIHINSHSWECALVEIILNQDWVDIIQSDIWAAVCINDKEGGGWSVCKLDFLPVKSKVHYESGKDFVETGLLPLLRDLLKSANVTGGEGFEIKVSRKEHVTISLKRGGMLKHTTKMPIRIELSSACLRILGIAQDQLKEGRYLQTDADGALSSVTSRFPIKLARSVTSLWVYSNIIKPHITGHMLTPLLRVIPVDKTAERDISRVLQFDTPYYFSLNVDYIESINISIYNAGGQEPLKFASPVVCKLHFRRRMPWTEV